MDLEERERFFAAGAAAGGYDGPPGGPPGGMGPGPPGGRMPPPHRSEHTPQSQNDWGPPNEPRVSTREVLARQRQAEYNEQKELQERRREAALEQKRGRGGVHDGGFGGYGDPANARQRGGGLDMAFDENNEQRPRPKGFRGLRDIHSDADAARRVAADEKKRAYAADLQRQIDEAKLRKQLAKQRSLEVDRHNLGMHNIIPDMRGDGLLDGVDGVNGENLGYTYADAHPPDAPRPYHPAAGETPQQHADEQHESNQYHEHQYRHQTHQTHNAHQRFAPAPRGSYAVGPPGGHFADGIADGAKAEKLRKKQAYQRDLEMQIAEKARRKAAEKLAQQEMDSRDARAAMTNNPWGKGGGGAPVARHSAAGPSHQHGYEPYAYGQSGHDRPTGYVPEPSADSHHGGAPGGGVETDAYPTQIVPGGRAGVPGMGRFAASASNPNPTPSHVPGPRVSLFARGHEEMHPAELEAKNRARDELQHALRLQIEEKRLRKEEEKARREAEEAADQRRLAIEQERLREAFEREQAEERFKAEERMRLEEEAYQAAADKRREQKLVDMPMPEPREPKAVVSGRDDDALSADANRGAPRFAPTGPPPPAAPPPPRGPTPAGARELNQLRSELQQEHRELMAAMAQQNANMAILQKRAEMAERHSAEARVELAEMRENLADQAFISSLPPVVSNGDPMTAHGVELPIYMSKTTDPITGPPHVAPDEDYGVFIRDAAGPHHRDDDLGPALDAGAPFVALGSSANDLAGQLGKEMGVGEPGQHNPSAKLLIRRGGMDVDDDVGSIVGDSAFIFPGQTMERAPFLKGSGASVFSGPGAERPAPEVGPKSGAKRSNDVGDGGVGLAERFGGPERPLGGDKYDDDPSDAFGMSTRDADASRKLDAVYRKNAARMRALGVPPEVAPKDFPGDGAPGTRGSDPDQLEGLLRNFLKANRGESGGVSAFDAGEPPSVEEGEHDDPSLGLNVEGAEDEDFGLGRPNTQMSMQAETRFVGSQY